MTNHRTFHFAEGNTVQIMELAKAQFKAILTAGDQVDVDAAGYGDTEMEAIADLVENLKKGDAS